jgi:hypothetical protein
LPSVAERAAKAVSAHGATDLSDGNMARPGTAESKSAVSEGDQAEPSTPPTAPKKVDAEPDSDTLGAVDAEDAEPAAA